MDVVLLPAHLKNVHCRGRTVVVFDVLRATTTMAAALAAGVREIRVFGRLEEAVSSAKQFKGRKLLCGESNCLRPEGFDLGNSPGDFVGAKHRGRVAFMSTTNGTRAIVAAKAADALLTGAIVNAQAVARAAVAIGADVTLLCAGTNGDVAMEDLAGAGAVADAMLRAGSIEETDLARVARTLFQTEKKRLRAWLGASQGGRNVIAAGLTKDVDFAAKLDALDVVGMVQDGPLRVKLLDAEIVEHVGLTRGHG
jgi:2-phosphosulfolactate phosphatase